ncbi:NAD(P)/FAD-dependent oxidoreductase [Actinocrispum wychmicini]|uniref:D-amino-acid dehydrogenase n=1 Tax=Actinocrispum wychmicini TaxID=1213861 RepID=A0A4R2JPW2_9PSEU|nr:FAD-dependent oxidoreductase [Actinocrispum wychmicini]TCO59216.1 D-amino-acid dehydrogenase [Actinocrispum wychmicini]
MRVIVVGSGVVGAVTSYHLAADGAEVLTVDAGFSGQATFAGAGVVFPWPIYRGDETWADFWWAAAGQYPILLGQLASDGEPDPGFARVGAITVSDEPLDAAELYAARERDPSVGEIEALPQGEPAARFPGLRADLCGMFVGGAGRVDGRLLQAALLRAADRYGARHLSGTAKLVTAGGRVTGVEIDGEVHGAHVVVVAAGAWTPALCSPVGIDVPVEPQRGQIAHLTVSDVDTSDRPMIRSLRDHYLLAFPGGRIVAGATREPGSGFDYRHTAGGVHKILADCLSIAPGLADATLESVRVGFRPLSTTGRPILGSPMPGLVVATGLGASGLTLAPMAGLVAAALALGRPAPVDLAPFTPW